MRLYLVCCGLLLTIGNAWAQYAVTVQIIDGKTKEPVIGAAVFLPATNRGGMTDAGGRVRLTDIPTGPQTLRISSLNYQTKEKLLTFPRPDSSRVEVIDVEPTSIGLQGVVVSATRTDSRIEDSPVRVEVLGLEEVEERTGMAPANISQMLAETPGV
ncbi:MAG: carboxypeptidase-like regulatory domain-containing protein [Rudanella sp.]|nr:carboxypeptidase-like regulatory domain-containing protein [Rudanella sp.]